MLKRRPPAPHKFLIFISLCASNQNVTIRNGVHRRLDGRHTVPGNVHGVDLEIATMMMKVS